MTVGTLVALLAFLFPLAYSPGAGNTLFAAAIGSKGLRANVPALAGYHIATFVATAGIGSGLGLTVLSEPLFVTALSAIGSIYVLWLGVRFFLAARSRQRNDSLDSSPDRGVGFFDGVLILLLNPKAYYIIILLFTQFLQPEANKLLAVPLLAIIFTLNNLAAFLVWGFAGTLLTRLFQGQGARKWIDYTFAVILVGVAIWMAEPLLT